jgi:molybdopterin-guanine dinucleotide biosynthesis protein
MFEDIKIPMNILIIGPKNTGKTSLIKKMNLKK